MASNYYTSHHGLLLKNYIINNNVNRKGGVNELVEVLGITRQGLYVLYEQREIKKKHREKLIEYLKLPENFFPDVVPAELENSAYVIDLQKRFIDLQGQILDMERKYHQSNYAPKLHPIVIDNENRDRIALIPRKAVAGYTKNYMDVQFISQLQTFSLPNFGSGFAFEIEGDSMQPSNIHHKDFVICEELVENIEQINKRKPYIIVLSNGDIVCKLIKPKGNLLTLVSTNKEYEPYNIKIEEVKQIWRVKGKFTPDVSF